MWKAIILSASPISEVRGGIPMALAQGVNPVIAVIVCSLANIAIVPIVFFFLEYVHKYFLRSTLYQQIFNKYMESVRKKVHPNIEKYGYLGLCIFVAIPLPLTGAYTGAAAAWLLGMNKIKAFFSITLGVFIASLIVLMISILGIKVFGL